MAPDILVVVPLTMGLPAPVEDDTLVVGVLPSDLEVDSPFPGLNLIGYRLASHGNFSANEALTLFGVTAGFLWLLSSLPFSSFLTCSVVCGFEAEVGSTVLATSASVVLSLLSSISSSSVVICSVGLCEVRGLYASCEVDWEDSELSTEVGRLEPPLEVCEIIGA